jgi:hypothetical protein
MTRRLRLALGAKHVVAVIIIVAVAMAAAGCEASGPHRASAGRAPARPRATLPASSALAPIASYRAAVTTALADHLRVWIETDLVKRWQEGQPSFRAAIDRVAALADRPGVVGIKVADELGYGDGMDSAAEIRQFLSDTARALHAAAPGKLILVDLVMPELGCLPGHQAPGSDAAACAARARSAYPQLTLAAVDSYLRLRAIDVLDLSTGLLSNSIYAAWGTTMVAAQEAAWQEVKRRGWAGLVRLQARKALAHPGDYAGTAAQAAAEVHVFVDIPLADGAKAVDIWTWHQAYQGQMYQLMNSGMRPNVLWDQLVELHRGGDVLFTHMSPHSVESGMSSDLAVIATAFNDVFLPAGTG